MKKNIIYFAMASLMALSACNNNDDDKGSISPVSDVTATPNIGSVVLKWTNPAEEDYYYTLVTYVNSAGEQARRKISRYAVDSEAGENHTKATIGGFEDTNTYTFTLVSYNIHGAASSPVTVSGTPQDANMAYYYVINSVEVTPRVQGACVSWVNEWEVPIYVNISYTDGQGEPQTRRISSSTTDSVVVASFTEQTSIRVTTESVGGDVSSAKEIAVTPQTGEISQSGMSIHDISSVWQAGYEGEKMLDEDLETYWHTTTSTGYPHWIVFDLGTAYYVNWLELVRRAADAGNNQTAAPTSIKWEYSLDGTNYTDLGTYDFDISLQFNHTYNFETPFYARYVKLTCLAGANSWAHMAEFLAYYGEKADHYADEAAAELTPTEPDPDDDATIDPNVEYFTFRSTGTNHVEVTQSEENKYEYTVVTTGGDPYVYVNNFENDIAGTTLVFHYRTSAAVNAEFFWCGDSKGGPAGGRETSFDIPKNDSEEWKTFKVNMADAIAKHEWEGKAGNFVRFDFGTNAGVTIHIRNIHFRAARDDE